MLDSQIYPGLNQIFRDIFLKDEIELKAEMTADDIEGWDSFAQIEIILAAQQYFGVKLTTGSIDNLHCVGDLVKAIGEAPR